MKLQKVRFCDFFREREREREHILSKFSVNRTVGFLRAKKDSCSTRRGQRVSTSFLEFRQTPRGRGFILLGLLFI